MAAGLTTEAAANLATTTKTVPAIASTTPRWLLRVLPWIDVPGGVYRRTSTDRRTMARHGSDQPGVDVRAGHTGEPVLPGVYLDYQAREYELSVAQTVMRVHTRVDDLYGDPMDQYEQQLRLTLDALAERREHDLVNSRDFGLLHAPPARHRLRTRTGPPTPADLDALICKQTSPRYLLAHPRAIAAFSRQCNRRGVSPDEVTVDGVRLHGWRGLPLLPCDKLPIAADHTTTILVVRPGEERQGIIGLRPATKPDPATRPDPATESDPATEADPATDDHPGVIVQRMRTGQDAVTGYLVSDYFSLAVLIPNAVCALDGVQL
jgi:Phage capsid-like protein